jgi:hypothetical protein
MSYIPEAESIKLESHDTADECPPHNFQLNDVIQVPQITYFENQQLDNAQSRFGFMTRKGTQAFGFIMITVICFYNIIECLENIYSQDNSPEKEDISFGMVKLQENFTNFNVSG